MKTKNLLIALFIIGILSFAFYISINREVGVVSSFSTPDPYDYKTGIRVCTEEYGCGISVNTLNSGRSN